MVLLSDIQACLETVPLGAELIDVAGKVIFANQEYFRIFSCPQRRVEGSSWLYRFQKLNNNAARLQWQAVQRGEEVEGEQTEQCDDGTLVTIRYRFTRLNRSFPDASAQFFIRYSQKVIPDNSCRPPACSTDSPCVPLIEQLPMIAWAADAHHNCTYVNKHWHQFTSAGEDEHQGQGWLNFIHPEDIERIQSASERHATSDLQYRIRGKDGEYRWFLEHSQPCLNKDGQVDGFTGICIDTTESLRESRVSEERKKQLRAMVEHAPGVAIQWFGRNGRIQLWNEASTQMFGFTAEEAIGKTFDELIHTPEEFECLLRTLGEIIHTNRSVGPNEYHFRRKDGSTGACLSTLFCIPSFDEHPLFCCMDIDITDRIRTENALRESEVKFRTLAKNFPDAIFILDPSDPQIPLKIAFTNDAVKTIHGYSPEELIGQSLALKIDDASTASHIPERILRIQKGEVIRFEATHIHRDGRTIPMSVTACLIPWDGKTMLLGINHDMTLQKAAEEARRESEARFRSAFYSSATGMAMVSLKGDFLDANSSLCQMLGYTLEELTATSFPAITHPQEVNRDVHAMKQLIQGEIPFYTTEKRYRQKDGSYLPTYVSAALVRNREGEPSYFVTQMLDLTEKKRLEQELMESQRLTVMKQMSGGLSHDFNNFITIILGYCETLLIRPETTDAQRSLILPIREAGHHASRIIRQLLAFSRTQPVTYERINLSTIVRGMEMMIRSILRQNFTLELRLAEPLPNIMADPVQIDQILVNLAINARDAMPEGGTLTIETAWIASHTKSIPQNRSFDAYVQPDDFVRLRVSDTGTGIPPDLLSRIFEPFFTTKGEGQGHGLGLSVVHGIISQGGGTIRVFSEPGKGTTFEVDLPACVGPISPDRPEAP
ncbi:Blue-light-activated protein [Planctopirus ephydatiae]|uniref:histidine kinase n=1 Tax=Planctopirus ephydatiae TaxID=2528019 RepID=A0A518GPM3_9PLAN|nr:PAS domain-containing sensor histidine kinase [Planctopirus ephydatiae]QDV30570.1 Blue-light-activated protein [Planctopirus ephydatiae]